MLISFSVELEIDFLPNRFPIIDLLLRGSLIGIDDKDILFSIEENGNGRLNAEFGVWNDILVGVFNF